jgi:hypothetical protein
MRTAHLCRCMQLCQHRRLGSGAAAQPRTACGTAASCQSCRINNRMSCSLKQSMPPFLPCTLQDPQVAPRCRAASGPQVALASPHVLDPPELSVCAAQQQEQTGKQQHTAAVKEGNTIQTQACVRRQHALCEAVCKGRRGDDLFLVTWSLPDSHHPATAASSPCLTVDFILNKARLSL